MPSQQPPRRIDQVTPGFYRVRKVKGGPWIGAEIVVQDSMIFVSEDGAPSFDGVSVNALADLIVDCVSDGDAFRHPLLRVAWFGTLITEAEYRHLLAMSNWAQMHAPDHPAANPGKRIDINTLPIKFII